MDLDVVLGDRDALFKTRVSVGRDLNRHIAKIPEIGESADLGTQRADANGENNTNGCGFPHERVQTRGPLQSIKAKNQSLRMPSRRIDALNSRRS